MTLRNDSAAVTARIISRFNRLTESICEQTNVCFIDNRNILAHHLNRSNLHLNSNGSKVLGSNLCRYLRRANLPPSGQELTTKLATGFSAGPLPRTQTFEPYQDVDQLLEPSERHVTGQILRPQLQRFSSFILGLKFSILPWPVANYFLLCRRWQTTLHFAVAGRQLFFYSLKTGV